MDSITVEFSKVRKMVNIIERGGSKGNDQISFEFIIGSLFPDVYNNINQKIKQSYTQGYIDGINSDEKNEFSEF